MNRDELQKKAAQFFEDYCTSGYGCCFEHKSVKIETIKNIESALIEVWNEAIEAATKPLQTRIEIGNHKPTWMVLQERILALKLDEKGKEDEPI